MLTSLTDYERCSMIASFDVQNKSNNPKANKIYIAKKRVQSLYTCRVICTILLPLFFLENSISNIGKYWISNLFDGSILHVIVFSLLFLFCSLSFSLLYYLKVCTIFFYQKTLPTCKLVEEFIYVNPFSYVKL